MAILSAVIITFNSKMTSKHQRAATNVEYSSMQSTLLTMPINSWNSRLY